MRFPQLKEVAKNTPTLSCFYTLIYGIKHGPTIIFGIQLDQLSQK